MKNKILKFCPIIFFLMIMSCSKTKYKGFRQYSSNFFSYYNTYFNIKQRYKIGYRSAVFLKQENTSDIVSVFDYENDPQFFNGVSQFKETAPKLSKLLVLRPNSKWIDDALLIEGKIRYLQGDLDSAVLILSHLVDYYPKGYVVGHLPGGRLKGFDEKVREAVRKKEPIKQSKFQYKFARNEGIIWLSKALIKKGQLERAQSLIIQAEADMAFPKEYRKDLGRVKIMLNLARQDYTKATENIFKLFEEEKLSKRESSRMNFILAQLYEKEGNRNSAKLFYEKALKGKLNDDLEFEATLKSLTYSESNSEQALSKLKKMLNKGKYAPNLDKIYLAIGNIHNANDRTKEALEAYNLAISFAKNPNQKFVIFEKIGSLNYQKSNYLMAARYYDSANQVIPENYPNKKEFSRKAEALKRLLTHYNKFIENDSILDLAALGPEKAQEKIERAIRKEYEMQKAKELQLETQTLSGESVQSTSLSGSKNWYFSTKESIEKGRINFQKKWGKIALQDNWKRATSNSDLTASNNLDKTESGTPKDEASIGLIAEIEAKRLPFDKSAKIPLIKESQSSLIQMARIYHYEILDLKKAIETYELLRRKYPENIPNEDEVLYSLYRLYLEKEELSQAESLKNELISKFPNSKYSLYAANPNAKSDDEKADLAVAKLYKEAYKQYRLANYQQAQDMCSNIEIAYPNHTLIPKVKLLKAFIYSYTTQTQPFKETLMDIVSKHAGTDEAKAAQEYLDILNKMGQNTSISDILPNSGAVPVSSKAENIALENNGLRVPNLKDIQVDKVPEKDLAEVNKPITPSKSVEEAKSKQENIKSNPTIDKNRETIPSDNTQSTADGLEIVNYAYKPLIAHFILYEIQSSLSTNSAKTLLEVFLKTKGYSKTKAEILDIGEGKFVTLGRFTNYESAIEFDLKNGSEPMLNTLLQNSTRYYISAENLDILYISSGWKQYQSFYQKNYR